MMKPEELKKIILKNKFKPVDDEYQYSNGKYSLFIINSQEVSIISEDGDICLAIPSLKVYDEKFFIKVLKALDII